MATNESDNDVINHGVPIAFLDYLADAGRTALAEWLEKAGIPDKIEEMINDLIYLEILKGQKPEEFMETTNLGGIEAYNENIESLVQDIIWNISDLGGDYSNVEGSGYRGLQVIFHSKSKSSNVS